MFMSTVFRSALRKSSTVSILPTFKIPEPMPLILPPALKDSNIHTVDILKWFHLPNKYYVFKEGDPIVEILTAKSRFSIYAPFVGVVRHVLDPTTKQMKYPDKTTDIPLFNEDGTSTVLATFFPKIVLDAIA